MTARRRSRRAGYVMIEALAALAVSAMVLAALPLASGILIRSWEKATTGSDTLDRLSTGLSVVRREISEMRRDRFFERGGDGPYAFLATSNSLGMVVPDHSGRSKTGQDIILIAPRAEANGNSLVRGMASFRPDMKNFESLKLDDEVVLLSGPWKYRFYYAARERRELKWYDRWLDEQDLPLAIRLDVLDYITGKRVIPSLVVPLRVLAEPGCIDERGGECGI
jgi:general secretion pathway protein J